jgi:hypothetical protein
VGAEPREGKRTDGENEEEVTSDKWKVESGKWKVESGKREARDKIF